MVVTIYIIDHPPYMQISSYTSSYTCNWCHNIIHLFIVQKYPHFKIKINIFKMDIDKHLILCNIKHMFLTQQNEP